MTSHATNPALGGRGAREDDLLGGSITSENSDPTPDLQAGCGRIGYDQLKVMAKDLKRPVGTLIALSPQNDPFYAGVPGRKAAAEWFAALWDRYKLRSGVHLRRIHYLLVS